MKGVFLLLGSNMNNRLDNLRTARAHIEKETGSIERCSSVFETAAWGLTNQDDFLNQVLAIKTNLDPRTLMTTLLAIEDKMGRRRIQKWGPRLIDIDLLFYHEMIINDVDLTVPHPGTPFRRFVLTPLAEIAPEFVHPVLQKKVGTLLLECPDPSAVVKLDVKD